MNKMCRKSLPMRNVFGMFAMKPKKRKNDSTLTD